MKDPILQNINRYVTLTSEEEHIILNAVYKEKYTAKSILLKPGEQSDITYFVISGLLRSYTVDDNGVEHVLVFASPDWWISDLYSYFGHQPAISFIDAIDDSEVYVLTRDKSEELYTKVPKLERFFRILTQKSLVANQQRIIDKMSLPAEMRYEKFQQRYPKVQHCIPQKQIASYIGVTPEFFSKMKSKILRKK